MAEYRWGGRAAGIVRGLFTYNGGYVDKVREEFERLVKERNPNAHLHADPVDGEYIVKAIRYQWEGYQMRQPEVDALENK